MDPQNNNQDPNTSNAPLQSLSDKEKALLESTMKEVAGSTPTPQDQIQTQTQPPSSVPTQQTTPKEEPNSEVAFQKIPQNKPEITSEESEKNALPSSFEAKILEETVVEDEAKDKVPSKQEEGEGFFEESSKRTGFFGRKKASVKVPGEPKIFSNKTTGKPEWLLKKTVGELQQTQSMHKFEEIKVPTVNNDAPETETANTVLPEESTIDENKSEEGASDKGTDKGTEFVDNQGSDGIAGSGEDDTRIDGTEAVENVETKETNTVNEAGEAIEELQPEERPQENKQQIPENNQGDTKQESIPESENESTNNEPKKGKKKLKVPTSAIILVSVLIVLGGLGAGVYFGYPYLEPYISDLLGTNVPEEEPEVFVPINNPVKKGLGDEILNLENQLNGVIQDLEYQDRIDLEFTF